MKRIILLIAIFLSVSYSYGQGRCTDSGYAPCGPNHECIPRDQCPGRNPPPPGLVVPIDTNMGLLFIAGLGLGIYFLVSQGREPKSSN